VVGLLHKSETGQCFNVTCSEHFFAITITLTRLSVEVKNPDTSEDNAARWSWGLNTDFQVCTGNFKNKSIVLLSPGLQGCDAM
jgi:hypothetical protein